MGNFVFDQNWSDETREGLLLKINLNPTSLLRAELIPIFVNDGQPVVAAGERVEKILSRTKNISERLGTSLELTEGKAVIFSRNQEIEPDLEQKFDQEGGQVI